jgi:hypothetical protein
MEFKVSELEREPIDFDLELAPGVVDLGEEATQVGALATSGHAEVLHEHSRFRARAAWSRSKFHSAPTST